jgi:hypothetical protein
MIESCLALLLSYSLHVNTEGDYNTIHPHIQCEHNNRIIGSYYNSENRFSFYIGKKFEFKQWTIDTTIVTGYQVSPIQPMIRFKRNNFYIVPMYERYINDINYGIVIGYEVRIR